MTRASGGGRILAVAANPSVDRTYEVPGLVPGSIHRPTVVEVRAGGKGLNVARAAHAIGAPVTAVAPLGGHQGAWIRDRLAAAGVAARVVDVRAETRTCVSILDRATGQLTELYERGEAIAPDEWDRFVGAVTDELATGRVRVVTLSGSLPPGAPADGFAHLASLAAKAGAAVLADVHGEPLRAVLAAGPTIVKVNEAEARALLPHANSGPDLCDGLRRLGATCAVVTHGRAGAVASGSDGVAITVGPPSRVGEFSVGSGDAFLAGLAAAWLDETTLEAALRVAAAAAEANAAVPGPGDLDLERYRSLLGDATAG